MNAGQELIYRDAVESITALHGHLEALVTSANS